MNIQQKVLQMTSKRKEKESQKAAQDSSVDHYEEIQKNLTDEQKRLISKYFPKLVNIMTQKEEDVYNLCRRYDFNEKVLDDYVNVIVIKSKEHSSEYGAWVEVTSRMKHAFPNKDEKAKKAAAETQNKDEKTKDKQEEAENSRPSKRATRKSYHEDDYYYEKEEGENYGNYRSSRRNKYPSENKRYSRSQGRPHRDDYYYNEQEEEEDYSRGQRNKKKGRVEKRTAKSPEPRGRVVVEYVLKTDSNVETEPEKKREKVKEKSQDAKAQENKKAQKKTKKPAKGDVVVYYVKKEETEETSPQQTETPAHTETKQAGQEKTGGQQQPATTTNYKELLRGKGEETAHKNQQQHHHQDKKLEKELEKMEKERQAEKERLEKLEREVQAERDRIEKLEKQSQADKDRLEKERQLELEREKEKYQAELARIEQATKKQDKRKNFEVQQISHYVPKNVGQTQVTSSPTKIETTTHNIKPEQTQPIQTQQPQQQQQQPIYIQSGLQTQFPQQQPTTQQQQIPQQQPVFMQPNFPFMTPYFPYFPQMQTPTETKDMPTMMSPMQMPFIVIPQPNGTSIIQPLYTMPNMTQPTTTTIPPNVSTTATSSNISSQTQPQKPIHQFTPMNPLYGNPTDDSNITKSRSMPATQPQNSFFNVGDKTLENNSLKNTQNLFNQGYFSMNLNQPGTYADPRINFFKSNDPSNKTQ